MASRKEAIDRFCWECMGGETAPRHCPVDTCSLFQFRPMGRKHPDAPKRRLSDEHRSKLRAASERRNLGASRRENPVYEGEMNETVRRLTASLDSAWLKRELEHRQKNNLLVPVWLRKALE